MFFDGLYDESGSWENVLDWAIQDGKREAAEGTWFEKAWSWDDVSVMLLNDILILPFWFVVARRRRNKKVEERARSKSTADALFW